MLQLAVAERVENALGVVHLVEVLHRPAHVNHTANRFRRGGGRGFNFRRHSRKQFREMGDLLDVSGYCLAGTNRIQCFLPTHRLFWGLRTGGELVVESVCGCRRRCLRGVGFVVSSSLLALELVLPIVALVDFPVAPVDPLRRTRSSPTLSGSRRVIVGSRGWGVGSLVLRQVFACLGNRALDAGGIRLHDFAFVARSGQVCVDNRVDFLRRVHVLGTHISDDVVDQLLVVFGVDACGDFRQHTGDHMQFRGRDFAQFRQGPQHPGRVGHSAHVSVVVRVSGLGVDQLTCETLPDHLARAVVAQRLPRFPIQDLLHHIRECRCSLDGFGD